MIHFGIDDFIKAGKKSLSDENYWSALCVALTLISMCSRIMFRGKRYNGTYWYQNENGIICWRDKKCYIDCCKKIMEVNKSSSESVEYDGLLINLLGNDFADVLYQLRCDVIHAGIPRIFADGVEIYISLSDTFPSTVSLKGKIIKLIDLCEIIFDNVETWINVSNTNKSQLVYVLDADNNKEDIDFFNKLCDK